MHTYTLLRLSQSIVSSKIKAQINTVKAFQFSALFAHNIAYLLNWYAEHAFTRWNQLYAKELIK